MGCTFFCKAMTEYVWKGSGKRQTIWKNIIEGRKEGLEEGIKEGIKEGREEGRKEGRTEGFLEALVSLVKEKSLDPVAAARKANMSESEFMKLVQG